MLLLVLYGFFVEFCHQLELTDCMWMDMVFK